MYTVYRQYIIMIYNDTFSGYISLAASYSSSWNMRSSSRLTKASEKELDIDDSTSVTDSLYELVSISLLSIPKNSSELFALI